MYRACIVWYFYTSFPSNTSNFKQLLHLTIWNTMCFLFVYLIETNCFIKGNKLFLLGKQNVSTCDTSSETITFKFIQSAYFKPNMGRFKGNMPSVVYRRCIATASIHCVFCLFTIGYKDNVGMYRQIEIFEWKSFINIHRIRGRLYQNRQLPESPPNTSSRATAKPLAWSIGSKKDSVNHANPSLKAL